MLFSLRDSTSAMLAMLPSQRFWITWSMVVSGETRDLYGPPYADRDNACLRKIINQDGPGQANTNISPSIAAVLSDEQKEIKAVSPWPLWPRPEAEQTKAGCSLVPKLEFSEPCLKFSTARHPSTSTPYPPLPRLAFVPPRFRYPTPQVSCMKPDQCDGRAST